MAYDARGTLKGANGHLTAGSSGLTATATPAGDGTFSLTEGRRTLP